MKILNFFLNLKIFDRFVPQMKEISDRVDEFHIAYTQGEVKSHWNNHFSFHKVSVNVNRIKSTTLQWWLSSKKVYNQLNDINVDLYYSLSGFLLQQITQRIASWRKKPYIIRLTRNHRYYRNLLNLPSWKKFIFDYYETQSLKRASLVIPVSKKLRKIAVQWGVPKNKLSESVPLGVDADHFKPLNVPRLSRFTIGYAGRISPEKGIFRLIRIAKIFPEIIFLIAGRKQMKVDFPNNIIYKGSLEFKDMPKFYNQCDLIILPSLTEGFPNVILESYACGKPVLATSEAFPEELPVFGAVSKIDEFPKIIREIRDEDLVSIGKKAREYVKKRYAWKKFGESMIKLFKDVLNDH